MSLNILLCGVGGQGIVLASRILATAAMNRGQNVLSAETIGMAQKGGSVFSHVRVGDKIESPMISLGEADIIIGFEPAEAARMMPYLREGGSVVVCSDPVMPALASLTGNTYSGDEMITYIRKKAGTVTVVAGNERCRKAGSPKVLNLIMLGEAVRCGELGFTMDEIKEALRQKVKPEFLELNMKALEQQGGVIW
ncbi:MAG: indolepyruvate oxidoreductase subunit beta [Firmicutes bacterium]|nr:indolepyruvate oxidoreductase subunit beta [Bacillota bacterium]